MTRLMITHPLTFDMTISGKQEMCKCTGVKVYRPFSGKVTHVMQNPHSLKWWYIVDTDKHGTVGVVQDNVEEVL